MSKKQRQPTEERFTLQFGEPDEEVAPVEVDPSDDVFLEENFMWKNAAAFLGEAAQDEPGTEAKEASQELDESQPSPLSIDADQNVLGTPSDPKIVSDLEQVELGPEDNIEPLVVDERQAGAMLTGPQDGMDLRQEDLSDDDTEPMVMDERQMAMVTSPEPEPELRDAFDEPDLGELRADPRQAVLPRGRSPEVIAPEVIAADAAAGGLFADDHIPAVHPPSERTAKTPWLIYGTFGLGLAVLGVAAVGMVLQAGKTTQPVGIDGGVAESLGANVTVDPATSQGAVVVQAPEPVLSAAVAVRTAAPEEIGSSEIVAQLKVFRLAVGPFVETGHGVTRTAASFEGFNTGAPNVVNKASADPQFAPDLGTAAPLAMVLVKPDQLALETLEDSTVVSVAENRIALDLSDQAGELPGAGEVLTTASLASVTVDPQVKLSDAPLLASIIPEAGEQNPQDARVSRSLSDAIAQATDDIVVLAAAHAQVSLDQGEVGAPVLSAFNGGIDLAELPSLSQFDLVRETLPAAPKSDLPELPIAAVRTTGLSTNSFPKFEGQARFEVGQLTAGPAVAKPLLLQADRSSETALPEPRIDVSRQLLAAVKLLEVEAARVLSGKTARPEELTKAAELANTADASTEPKPADTNTDLVVASVAEPVEPEIDAVSDTQALPAQPEAISSSDTQAEAPKEPEADALTAAIPAAFEWISAATWEPSLGFGIFLNSQGSQPVLEINQTRDGTIMPNWASDGAQIVSVNGSIVETEAAFMEALLSGTLDEATGLIPATLEMRARAGLDPRIARVFVPVARSVRLSDGTEITSTLEGNKWITEVSVHNPDGNDGLETGDILLRDFMTKSKLGGPLDVEQLFEAMTEAKEGRVEFAVMRDGELASGGVTLTR